MLGTHLLAKRLVVYLAGVVTAPLIKPVVKGTVKGTVKVGMQMKKAVGEATAEVQGLAAEVKSESNAAPLPPVATTVIVK